MLQAQNIELCSHWLTATKCNGLKEDAWQYPSNLTPTPAKVAFLPAIALEAEMAPAFPLVSKF